MASIFSRVSMPGTPAGQPQQPSMFGNPSATPAAAPPANTASIFGSSTTPATTSASSGSTPSATAPSSTPSAGGMFGVSNTTAAAPSGGSLFGNLNAAPATTSAGSGLFGNATAPAAATPAANSTGSGLFGNTNAAATPAVGGTSSIFGQPAAAAAAASASTGTSLFGAPQSSNSILGGSGLANLATTSSVTPAPSLFGAAAGTSTGGGILGGTHQPATNTTGGGLFSGQQQAPASTTGFGGSIFGCGIQQAGQNTVPAATIDFTRLTPTTRFSDCHQSVQQELEELEKEIQKEIALSCQLADRFTSHREALDSIPIDASVLATRLATTKSFQMSDQAAYGQVRAQHDADEQASTLSIRTLDLFRLPHAQRSQYVQRASTYSAPQRETDVTGNKPMIAYFNKQADFMEQKMGIIKRSVRQIEESLVSVETQAIAGARGVTVNGQDLTALTGGVAGRQDARRLNMALREFTDALKDVAGRIVDAQEGLEIIKGGRR